jgi:hypothetical protein
MIKIDSLYNKCGFELDPFVVFEYSIRSSQTRDSYFRRLKTFLNFQISQEPSLKINAIFLQKMDNKTLIGLLN